MVALVIGGSGMLGSDLVSALRKHGHTVLSPSSKEFDLSQPDSIAQISKIQPKPDWCFNCAAYTAVDKAESEEKEATLLNALAPGILAVECQLAGVRLMHVSTDFVFNGSATQPYPEETIPDPLGIYGWTKEQGEEAVLSQSPQAVVVRTSWLFGPNGNSFPRTIIRAWEAGRNLRVVADQTGSPTYTADLAKTLIALAEKQPPGGIYHASGPDSMTWNDFAILTLEAYRKEKGLDKPVLVEAIQTSDWPTPARRPKYSVLSNDKIHALGIAPMRPIQEALREFCTRLA